MPEQKFYDTQPTGENTEVEYRDPTDVDEVEEAIKHGEIDELSQKFALWIRTKMWRRHVREALARMMEYTSVLFNKIKDLSEDTLKRQEQVEQRQTSIERQMVDVIANATVDGEVINARDSETYGTFPVLDGRLENIEKLLITYVPVGFDVTINHSLNAPPTVNVRTWTYGLGVMPLGTEPVGLFGGSASQSVASQVTHKDATTCVVSVPFAYRTDGDLVKIDNTHYLIIDEETKRSLMFELFI
ncbi:hypothetical protein [Enterococcus sp. AZ126]|uniref:hypothetical protein n=1 Tax=Enterococcus sp. AZ126 TaxID=2774635 RepID=UPI003F2023DA